MKELRCAYCGKVKKIPIWYLKIHSIFLKKYYFSCQVCHHYNCYGMYLRVYHDSTDKKEKEANRLL